MSDPHGDIDAGFARSVFTKMVVLGIATVLMATCAVLALWWALAQTQESGCRRRLAQQEAAAQNDLLVLILDSVADQAPVDPIDAAAVRDRLHDTQRRREQVTNGGVCDDRPTIPTTTIEGTETG